ncbi:GIN domain-containing protein [Arenimonas sp.]|uniref:GIN domain-containing protein n=1 Tax=Arenimonas sp. TaxID=1872635 RepID=UPI0035AF3E72
MKLLALPLLLVSGLATASDCKHEEIREIAPDLDGIRLVRFEVASHDLRVDGVAGDAATSMRVRACASDPDYLPQLAVETSRSGDTLLVRIERKGRSVGVFFNPTYAYMEVEARLPAGLAYEIDLGSGDAQVNGVASLSAEVGSGDLEVRDIAGTVRAQVGSGDIEIDDAGSLDVRSVGSGDLDASRIRGDVQVGSVGSGDVTLNGVGGNVGVGRIGSGDLDVDDVAGDLEVEQLGSGDVDHSRVRGKISVPKN